MHAKAIVFLTCVIGLCSSIPVPNDGVILFSLSTAPIQNMQQPKKYDCSPAIVYTFRLFRFISKPIATMPVPPISGIGMKCGSNKKCVPRNLCSNRVINDDGASLIDPRMDDDSTCTADETCCSIADIVEKTIHPPGNNPGNEPTPPSTNTGNHAQCGKSKKCVPQNLCSNGVVNEDGATLIDLRMDDDSSCPAQETCCSLVDIIDQPFKSPELKPTEKVPTTPVTSRGNGLPCAYPKKCVLENFCSSETANDGATHINIRSSMYYDVQCQSNETCCFPDDIVNIRD